MKGTSIALLFCAVATCPSHGSGSDSNAQDLQSVAVLTDGVDIDKMFLDANSPDPVTSTTAKKALETIRNKNPVGKRRLAYGVVSLELPSWQWDYNRKLGVQGIAVDLKPENAGGDMASVLVDRLPGMSDAIVGNVLGDLPEGAKVSKAELKSFGAFVGTGSREIVLLPGPTPQRAECVLFYPKNKLEGYYIFTMFSGPTAGDQIEGELGRIAKSIRGH